MAGMAATAEIFIWSLILDVNTLMDFRHKRLLRAQNGSYGTGKLCTGKKGEDLLVPVPIGTSCL